MLHRPAPGRRFEDLWTSLLDDHRLHVLPRAIPFRCRTLAGVFALAALNAVVKTLSFACNFTMAILCGIMRGTERRLSR